MAFPPERLTKDEEVKLDLVPHWWFITPAGFYLGLAVVFGIVVVVNDYWSWLQTLAGILVLVALAYFGIRYAQWRTTNFVVTNERLISRGGVVSKKGMEIPIDRVNTVRFEQGTFERMVGSGSLMVESAGESGQQYFPDIRNPNDVQAEIYRQMEAFEERRHMRLGQAVAGSQANAGPTIPEQIEKLDQLRKQGTLTEEQFETKKQELLDRM